MTAYDPEEKEKVLDDISNEILNKYFESQSGLYSVDKSDIRKYLKVADENKSGNYATYHYIHALVFLIKLQYENAKKSFMTAIRNAPNDIIILGNYSALLVDMEEYDEAYELIKKLIKHHKVYDAAIMNNLYRMALNNLDVSYFEDFADDNIVTGYLQLTKQFVELRDDIDKVGISLEEYTEFMKILSRFVLNKTRQNFKPRISIVNGLDKHLTVEIFLNINLEEASYLDSEFTECFMDYVFEKDRYDLLGKFVVFFRQEKNRYDGTEHPDALYLGMDEELTA